MTYQVSQRRAARLLPMNRGTLRYVARRDDQLALRRRLRELAAVRVGFGYRRLTVLLRREGWRVNAKRVWRLYREEGLTMRTKRRKKLAMVILSMMTTLERQIGDSFIAAHETQVVDAPSP